MNNKILVTILYDDGNINDLKKLKPAPWSKYKKDDMNEK